MISNETPYVVYVKGVPDAYYEGDRIALGDIMHNNLRYSGQGRKNLIAYRENLDFKFTKAIVREGYCHMAGLAGILFAMKADETITNKTLQGLLLSYFGNGAKKKLAEFKTAGELIAWITDKPLEVLEAMGIDLPPPKPVAEGEKKPEAPVAAEAAPAPRKKKTTTGALVDPATIEALRAAAADTTFYAPAPWTVAEDAVRAAAATWTTTAATNLVAANLVTAAAAAAAAADAANTI